MLKITNIPNGEKISELYDIKINGECAKANFARVSAMPFNTVWPGHQRVLEQTEEAAFINFSMSEPVTVEVTAKKDFKEAVVRPISDGIITKVDGRRVSFTVEHAGQYILELDGWHNALHIFANSDCDWGVSADDKNVIYFPAGVHHPGVIKLEDNQTLYIDKDAVVYGAVVAIKAENIKILGEGIIDGSWEERTNTTIVKPQDQTRRNTQLAFSSLIDGPVVEPVYPVRGSVLLKDKDEFWSFLQEKNYLNTCIHIFECKNVEVRGVTMRDPSGFTLIAANCENMTIDNTKIVGSWRYNSDGIDIFNSRNCVLKNSFLRCFDDCIVLKGIPGWDTWSMENILIDNCVTWCDWGANLEIGAETCAPEYRNIIFRDCDCIHNTYTALRIHSCDRALVHNIIYDDIRAEFSKYDLAPVYQMSEEMCFEESCNPAELIRVHFDGEIYFSNDRIKGQIEDLTYRNIKIYSDEGLDFPSVSFEGYSEEHTVRDVRIEGLYYNGKAVDDEKLILKNEFTDDIRLK